GSSDVCSSDLEQSTSGGTRPHGSGRPRRRTGRLGPGGDRRAAAFDAAGPGCRTAAPGVREAAVGAVQTLLQEDRRGRSGASGGERTALGGRRTPGVGRGRRLSLRGRPLPERRAVLAPARRVERDTARLLLHGDAGLGTGPVVPQR